MDRGDLICLGIIGAVGGAITALCLSFSRTLPALAIGGMIGAGAFAALVALAAMAVYLDDRTSFDKNKIPYLFAVCATSSAIGVGLAVALTPEIFAKWNTAIVAGAAIGAIGLVLGYFATDFLLGEPDPSLTGPNATKRSAGPKL